MAIKNVLLAFSGEASFESSLNHSIKLAKHHDAWITAIMRNARPYTESLGAILTDELRARLRNIEDEDVQSVRKVFETAMRVAGLEDRGEFIPPDKMGQLLPSEMARHYDLVVTGFQSELRGEEHHVVSPDLIALRSGRPVLVVPKGYISSGLADHVLVAWDGKRSAARALGDAMEVTESKRRATVLTIGGAPVEMPVDGGILRHLQRHGVEAVHLHRRRKDASIASVIQKTAEEVGAKLIVMGAYEHSKFAEDLFGGVTHEVLHSARVPVFMSH
ncbi:MAG: universal stress protein [Magnetospiraceae bacterium]